MLGEECERGKEKVATEWGLIAIAQNIAKKAA